MINYSISNRCSGKKTGIISSTPSLLLTLWTCAAIVPGIVTPAGAAKVASSTTGNSDSDALNGYTNPLSLFGGENYKKLDKKRHPRYFPTPTTTAKSSFRDQPGFTYKDDIRMSLTISMDDETKRQVLQALLVGEGGFFSNLASTTGLSSSSSSKAFWDLHMSIDSNTKQSTTNPTNLETSMAVQELEMNIRSIPGLDTMSCDSRSLTNKNGDLCSDLFELVGTTETIETNPDGDVVSIETYDETTITTTSTSPSTKASSLNAQFGAQQFAASMHYDKHSEIMKWLPDRPVKPSDKWNDIVDMQKALGVVYTGTSYLKGYTSCLIMNTHSGKKDRIAARGVNDDDCAVFVMDGIMHVEDFSIWVKDLLLEGEGENDYDHDMIHFTGAQISNTIVWNVQHEMPQWVQANISMYMEIRHPKYNDGHPIDIPLNFIFELSSEILSTAEDNDDGLSKSSLSVSTSRSAIQSILVWLFSVSIVCGIVTGLYVSWKKRNQRHNYSSTRSYNYGVGNEWSNNISLVDQSTVFPTL